MKYANYWKNNHIFEICIQFPIKWHRIEVVLKETVFGKFLIKSKAICLEHLAIWKSLTMLFLIQNVIFRLRTFQNWKIFLKCIDCFTFMAKLKAPRSYKLKCSKNNGPYYILLKKIIHLKSAFEFPSNDRIEVLLKGKSFCEILKKTTTKSYSLRKFSNLDSIWQSNFSFKKSDFSVENMSKLKYFSEISL